MFNTDIEQLNGRYQLLCRASHFEPDDSPVQHQLAVELRTLQSIIADQLPELARQRSPHNFAELQLNLQTELERFHEFCEFPDLAGKVAVGLGGAFSAGKSSLINALLGCKRLATEVDPTTSLPTYLLKGKTESITALNLFKRRVELNQEEFLSLTHDEKERYGSQISGLLQSAFISLPDFPFDNLTLLDTPGYSKPDDAEYSRADENIARAQLNSAQFIIWVVSAEGGVISENDLRFLACLRQDIPVLVVLSRADKRRPEDIQAITELVKQTLDDSGLSVLDVIPFSSRKKKDYPIEPIRRYLDEWNHAPLDLGFALNFKRQFGAYQFFIEQKQGLAQKRLEKLNRILAISDDDQISRDSTELRQLAANDQTQLGEIRQELAQLQKSFFHSLKKIGQHQGIPLPEPDDIALLDGEQSINLLDLLRQEREFRGMPYIGDIPDNWNDLKTFMQALDLNTLNMGGHPVHVLELPDTVKYSFASLLAVFSLQGQSHNPRRLALLKRLYATMGLPQGITYFLKQAKQMDGDAFSDLLDVLANSEVLHLLIVDIMALLTVSDTDLDATTDALLREFSGLLDGDDFSSFLEECIGYTGMLYLAATTGNADIKFKLANILNSSRSLFADKVMARKWFQLAAEAGNAKAQYKLGNIYSKGQHGITPNQELADYWYDKAAQQGHQKAIEIMNRSGDLWSNPGLRSGIRLFGSQNALFEQIFRKN